MSPEERLIKLVADVIMMHACDRYDHHLAHECVTAKAVIENLRRRGAFDLLAAGCPAVSGVVGE